jgi:hypothetical protein
MPSHAPRQRTPGVLEVEDDAQRGHSCRPSRMSVTAAARGSVIVQMLARSVALDGVLEAEDCSSTSRAGRTIVSCSSGQASARAVSLINNEYAVRPAARARSVPKPRTVHGAPALSTLDDADDRGTRLSASADRSRFAPSSQIAAWSASIARPLIDDRATPGRESRGRNEQCESRWLLRVSCDPSIRLSSTPVGAVMPRSCRRVRR